MPLMAQDTGSCAALHDACQAAGYSTRGSTSKGAKLRRDCMDRLLSGIAAPGNGRVPLPVVDTAVLAACQAENAKSGKATISTPANGPSAGAAPVVAKALPAGTARGPNIVMILADDFSLDLMTT